MRQIILQLSRGYAHDVANAAKKCRGRNMIHLASGEKDVFFLSLPNNACNAFLEQLSHIEGMEVNLIPRGVISLYPPKSKAPEQVADVKPKSELEIYLGGIQSVGSIFGLIGYSFSAGIIVWIGLYTTTVYLLVAAMLIAPLAGPAMNAALATAAGKWSLLQSSLGRYFLAIGTGLAATLLMAIVSDQQVLTPLMVEVSQVSEMAVLLPLVAGFAGAINICQSQRDSLVSGAAVGVLVAASLAPPLGLMGTGLYMMDWDIVLSSFFRIILQLLGIHLSATMVFFLYGRVSPEGVRFLSGDRRVFYLTSCLVGVALAAMVSLQFSQPFFLRKASLSTELTRALDAELKKLDSVEVVEREVSFSQGTYRGEDIVTFSAAFLSRDDSADRQEVEKRVVRHLQKHLRFPEKNVHEVYRATLLAD